MLPFTLLAAIFGIAWEHLSLFGAAVLYLGILNTALGRKVRTIHASHTHPPRFVPSAHRPPPTRSPAHNIQVSSMWRLMVLLAIALALAIMTFDLQPFQRHATSATLYWVGLRRGDYIPDPDAPPNAPPPPEAQGWRLSPSAEAYLLIAFLAALQFFYNAGAGEDEGVVVPAVDADGAEEQSEAQPQPQQPPALRGGSGRSKTVTFSFHQESGASGADEDGRTAPPLREGGAVAEGEQGLEGDAAPAGAAAGGDGRAATARLHCESSVSSVSEPPSPGLIDNTRALAPGVTTLIEMLYKGKIVGAEEEEEEEAQGGVDDDGAPQPPPSQDGGRSPQLQSPDPLDPLAEEDGGEGESQSPHNPLALRSPEATATSQHLRPGSPPQQHHPQSTSSGHTRRSSVGGGSAPSSTPIRLFGGLYHLLHRAVLTLLAGGAAFAFELCVILTVTAALAHADLVSFLYLALFGCLVALPRATLRAHWGVVIHALALLVLAEYMFILRLPPAISYESNAAAQLLGSRQCSIFAQYTPEAARRGPYSYGQWFGLCITEDGLVLLDFLVLVLAIVQHKRFKAGA